MSLKLTDPSLLKTQAYIDGHWTNADSGQTYAVENPANGTEVAVVSFCGRDETGRAIEAAHCALRDWQALTAKARSAHLEAWHDLMIAHQDDLAKILTAEQGKPLAEAQGEILYGASYIKWFAEEAKRIYGDTMPSPSPDKRFVTIKQGVGVVACITPWNFPNAMLARKIAPALAAGCTVVCKPANQTPLSAFAMVELADRAGIPAGVINIVSGETVAIGAVLTASLLVRKLTFTGSTAVGKRLMSDCAATMKRLSMELGGNAPFIVFDDADIDAAVSGAMVSKFRNAGQTCVCANRFLVQAGVYDQFVAALSAAMAQLKMGSGDDPSVTIGPLIDGKAADNVRALILDATDHGATQVNTGVKAEFAPTYVAPTLLTDVTSKMRVFREEIFGPVAPIIRFDTEAEAIAMANDTEFGLAAYFYSRDIGRVWRVGEGLEFGMVGINTGAMSNEMAPFGGVKESGQGREGSKYGLDDYLEIKSLCMGGLDQ
ncbi:glutarate-semialdehyde dehydrogenase DavD [Algimonas arctica]|uniref:Glutarate-semialdehyde dehydrogenase DavD n=1 Tax=Algimonas arctica TaxID=1479486 RepID=A0A8J3G2M8_9PROT|nr:NAD-dependent succinate-semialdehyde dehydrogenase [Algimonas arctica]GHA97904.1 glutarate-semialdehyde dehydrogenase DavD [Algimonas arctica]